MADLYSIIVLMEHLEKAFIRDSIQAEEYTPQCANLIAKYKTTLNFLSDSVTDLESFMSDYKVNKKIRREPSFIDSVMFFFLVELSSSS